MNYIINNMKTFIQELFSSTRLKSFLWRGGVMGVVAMLTYFQTNIQILQLDVTSAAILGLVLAEVTKALNNTITNA